MATATLIIPVYNCAEYLRECIDSATSQSMDDIRIILSDDGSTDASPAICDEAARADSRISVMHSPNGGLSAARNRALDLVETPWVFFLDSDDAISPRTIELLLNEATRSEADIVRADFSFTSLIDEPITLRRLYPPVEALETTLYQHKRMFNSVCGALMRTSLFANIRFKPHTGYEDLEIIPKLYLAARRIGWVNARLYHYRQHPASYIHTWSDSRADVLDVADGIEEALRDNPLLHKAAADRKLSAAFNIFMLSSLHGGDPSITARCWETIRCYRLASLLNPKVRMKNKVGILASFGGRSFIKTIMKWTSRY